MVFYCKIALPLLPQEYAGTTNLPPNSYVPEPGEVCACQFGQDGRWYRASCDAINLDATVEVTYLDYGNAEQVHVTSIRRITSDAFLKQEVQVGRKDYVKQPKLVGGLVRLPCLTCK